MAENANLDPSLHGHGDTHGHGTRRAYIIGFLASAILTAVPFWLVMERPVDSALTIGLVAISLAIVQIIVHVRFFLNIDAKGEGGWTLVSFIFTAIIVVITIGGSIWAMYQMSTNMMPMSPVDVMHMG